MTVTEELHRMLDERGVEYRFNDATKVFEWHFDGTDGEGFAHATEVHGGVNIIACSLTPEQAIAATLGDSDATHERQGDADLAAENAELRELCRDMMWTIRHAHGYFKNDTHELLMTYMRGRDGKPTHVAYSLTFDEEMYEKRMTKLGIEVDDGAE